METAAGMTDASGERFAVVQELPHWHYKPDAPRGESMENKAQTRDPGGDRNGNSQDTTTCVKDAHGVKCGFTQAHHVQ